MSDLEAQLQEADAACCKTKLITTDGLFSMDGFIAPLDQITALARKYNALVHIDECHATGFLGATESGAPFPLLPVASPRRLQWLNGPDKAKWLCLYELDGDRLKLAFVDQGTDPPAKIEPAIATQVGEGVIASGLPNESATRRTGDRVCGRTTASFLATRR